MVRKILNNKQWEQIEHLLPGKATDRGVTAKDNRTFVEAVLWIARTGSPWRDLPRELGSWHRVYVRYSRWAKNGVWKHLFEALASDPTLEKLMIDGSIVRVHQHGASKKKRGISSSKAKAVAV
jgi:transposase